MKQKHSKTKSKMKEAFKTKVGLQNNAHGVSIPS
jgi:hypothetical protein